VPREITEHPSIEHSQASAQRIYIAAAMPCRQYDCYYPARPQ